jgi:beta-lactamase regulating signal transducer with metallopeptidase domain
VKFSNRPTGTNMVVTAATIAPAIANPMALTWLFGMLLGIIHFLLLGQYIYAARAIAFFPISKW